MAGLQSGEGQMIMINSVVWAQYINVTDTQTDRETNSNVAITNAVPANALRQGAKVDG